MRFLAFCLTVLVVSPGAVALAETAEEKGLRIAADAEQASSGYRTERAQLTMELINAHGDSTTRRLRIDTIEGTTDGDKSRAEFEWPADARGVKLLTWTHKKGDDDQWLYLPEAKRVKRISSNNKSGSFMGSEFSYEDLASQEVEKFTYKFIDEPTETGRKCWRIERYPVDSSSGYARHVVWIDKEYQQPIRIDYYDRKNEQLKTARATEFQKIGKFWRVGRIHMDNVQTKKKSTMTWTKRELGVELDESLFRSNALAN